MCQREDISSEASNAEHRNEESISRAPPRRLKSGGPNGIDLQRFDKTDAQRREFYSPPMGLNELSKSASLPISTPQTSTAKTERSEYSNDQFNRVKNLQRLKRMSGVYQLVRSRSDSVRPMSDLLEFSWPLRKAFENSDLMEVRVLLQ